MSLETYPETLPLPDHGSYGNLIDAGLVRTEIPVPAPNQERRFNAPRVELSMTFSMDNATYETWLNWMLLNAWRWFYMPVVSPADPDTITSVRKCRVISDFQYVKRGDNWLSVSIAMEMIQSEDFALQGQ